MTRIVYGVAGEGSGHSSRAREMARHLVDHGHELKLVSYDRGYRNLKEDFDVFETEGLTIASRDNRVSIVRTEKTVSCVPHAGPIRTGTEWLHVGTNGLRQMRGGSLD